MRERADDLQAGLEMSPLQSKRARQALNWNMRDLATAAQVSLDTVARLERGEHLLPRTVSAIRSALEAAGVEFTDGDAPGVRLRNSGRSAATRAEAEEDAVEAEEQSARSHR